MSHRGRIKRRGRRNCVLSVLVLLLLLWYVSTSVSRVTISSVTAFAAGACGATSGWVGWRTPKAHKRQTPIKQVRPGARFRPVLAVPVADPQRADPLDRRHRRWPVVAGAAIAARQLAIGGRRDCVGQRTGQAEQGPVPAGGDVRDYALHDVFKRACSGGRVRLSCLTRCGAASSDWSGRLGAAAYGLKGVPGDEENAPNKEGEPRIRSVALEDERETLY